LTVAGKNFAYASDRKIGEEQHKENVVMKLRGLTPAVFCGGGKRPEEIGLLCFAATL